MGRPRGSSKPRPVARIRALVRRAAGQASNELVAGPVRLDVKGGRVTVDGHAIKLTSHELRLLSYLMHHKGKVISRTDHIAIDTFYVVEPGRGPVQSAAAQDKFARTIEDALMANRDLLPDITAQARKLAATRYLSTSSNVTRHNNTSYNITNI